MSWNIKVWMKIVQIRALRSPRRGRPCLLQGQLEAELKPGGAAVGVLSGLMDVLRYNQGWKKHQQSWEKRGHQPEKNMPNIQRTSLTTTYPYLSVCVLANRFGPQNFKIRLKGLVDFSSSLPFNNFNKSFSGNSWKQHLRTSGNMFVESHIFFVRTSRTSDQQGIGLGPEQPMSTGPYLSRGWPG